MSLLSIASGIFAVARAIPQVKEVIMLAWNLFVDKEINQMESGEAERNEEFAALMRAIKDAKTNEDRKQLSITLHRLRTNGMSDGYKPKTGETKPE